MTWFDKIVIILGVIAMSLIFWHVFTPHNWHIEGFYGFPMHLCWIMIGIAIGTSLLEQ